jgi:hypothetical protein
MYSSGDLGRARQADMMRRAEMARLAREARAAGRGADGRGGLRRAMGAVVSTLLWPVRH